MNRFFTPLFFVFEKSKASRQTFRDFLRNSFWFGSFIHERSEEKSKVFPFLFYFSAALHFSAVWAEDINLVSWIKMRFEGKCFHVFFSFFLPPPFIKALFYRKILVFYVLLSFRLYRLLFFFLCCFSSCNVMNCPVTLLIKHFYPLLPSRLFCYFTPFRLSLKIFQTKTKGKKGSKVSALQTKKKSLSL